MRFIGLQKNLSYSEKTNKSLDKELEMLILTRRNGEAIRIGNDTTITIYEDRNGRIKVGIDAPRHIAVHREEIYLRIQNGKNSQKHFA